MADNINIKIEDTVEKYTINILEDGVTSVLTSDTVEIIIIKVEEFLTDVSGGNGTNGTNGSNGADGADGTDGTDGTNGVDGSDGANGSQGIQGETGLQGTVGSDGADGSDGTNGTDGSDGSQGTQGIQGITGNNGTNGTDGDDGSTGSQGIQGIQGVAGNDGTNGSDGADVSTQSYMVRTQSRIYCYSDLRWVGFGTYGNNNSNFSTSKGTSTAPSHSDSDVGIIQLPTGATLQRIEVIISSVSNELTGCSFSLSAIGNDITTLPTSLAENVIVAPTSLGSTVFAGDAIWTTIDLSDYTLTDPQTLTYAFKPQGTLTGTRYYSMATQLYYTLP